MRTIDAQQIALQEQIRVEVREGADLTHRTNTRYATPIIVAISDLADRPIPGADVEFTAPSDGASVIFVNGGRTLRVQTDAAGLARISGLHANGVHGQFKISVRASFGGEVARADVGQTNERPPLVTRKRLTLVAVGCAAVLIPVFALRPAPVPQATISAVTPTGPVGIP